MEWFVNHWEAIGVVINAVWTFYLHSIKKDK